MTAGSCTYCVREMDPTGTPSLLERTADHVVPACAGGRKTVPCCWHCNQIKGRMSPRQWTAFMADNPCWWEMPEYQRTRSTPRVAAAMTAAETAAFLRCKSKEAEAIAAVRRHFPGAAVVAVRPALAAPAAVPRAYDEPG